MSNWSFHKNGMCISWYNLHNDTEELKYKKERYNIKDYFRNIFRIYVHEYGIEFNHIYDRTCFIVTTPKYLYWLFLRDSDNWKDKGKWCLKTMKSDNDGTSCG